MKSAQIRPMSLSQCIPPTPPQNLDWIGITVNPSSTRPLMESCSQERKTRIGNGLTNVQNEIFPSARREIPNILVAMIDGVSIDEISLPSAFLKAMKVVMFSVGVGEFYAREQLDVTSSDPDSTYVLEEFDFDSLPEVATQLKNFICIGK